MKLKNRNSNNLPFFKKTLKIEVIGFNQTKIINALNDNSITLKNVKRISPKTLQLNIDKSESKKTFAILEKMCYNYNVLAKGGIDVLLGSIVKRIGLIVGIFIFSLMAIFSNTFIWRVEISGNELIDSQFIQSRLNEIGLKKGKFKSSLNADEVASFLRGIDGIAEGTLEIKGTTAYVKVFEEKVYSPPDNDNIRQDIVSGYDAEITKIIVEKGTSNVKIGTKVAKGTTLIKGEIYNLNNELIGECKAKGLVYGKVTFSQTHIFSSVEQYYERTGNQTKYTSLSIFNLRIGKKQLPPWERQVTESKMFLIPIKITHTKCYETKLIEKERNIDEYVESLKRQALLDNIIKTNNSNTEVSTTLTPLEGNLLMLNIYIQAEILLGEL